MTIAELGIKVDSSQAKLGAVNLDSLAASATKAEAATTRMGAGATTALKNTSFQTANVAAQFQDIGVQLASGQSPFLIALQQGTQLSAALGNERGLKGTLSTLAAGFASVISPVSLLTIGVIALGGLGVQALTSMIPKVKSLDDLLTEHKTIVADIRKSWDEASKGLDAYDRKSQTLLAAQARDNATLLAAQLRQKNASLLEQVGVTIAPEAVVGNQAAYLVKQQFAPFEQAILDLRAQAKAGKPDFDAFYEAVEKKVTSDPGLRALADQLEISTADAEALARALGQAGDAASIAGDKYAGSISDFAKLPTEGGLIDQLRKLAPDLRTAKQQAIDTYNQNSGLDVTGAGKAQLDFVLKQIDQQKAMEDATTASRQTAAQAKSHAAAIDGVTGSLKDQLAQLHETDREQFISQQLSRAKADAASKEGKAITSLAGQYFDQKAAVDALNATMKDIDDTGKSLTEGFFSTLKRDLMQGTSLWQSFGDAAAGVLDSLADKALKMAADGIWDSVFGAISGGISGALGGGATGGTMGAGLWGSAIFAGVHHSGGVAGSPTMGRNVSASVFDGAQRYHGGGIAGLRPDEVPAILQRGERVIPANGIAIEVRVSVDDNGKLAVIARQVAGQTAQLVVQQSVPGMIATQAPAAVAAARRNRIGG